MGGDFLDDRHGLMPQQGKIDADKITESFHRPVRPVISQRGCREDLVNSGLFFGTVTAGAGLYLPLATIRAARARISRSYPAVGAGAVGEAAGCPIRNGLMASITSKTVA